MLLHQVAGIPRSQRPPSSHAQDEQGLCSIDTPATTHTTTHAINRNIPHTNSTGTYPPIIPPHFYSNSIHNFNPMTHSVHSTVPLTLPNMTASTSSNNHVGPACSNFQTLSQASLSRLFEPTRNRRLHPLASRRSRKPAAIPWEHDFICLAVPGQTTVPTPTETAELKKRGLGKKSVRFPGKEGTHLDLLKGLHGAFPPLKYGGGFKLYRSNRSNRNCLKFHRNLMVILLSTWSMKVDWTGQLHIGLLFPCKRSWDLMKASQWLLMNW